MWVRIYDAGNVVRYLNVMHADKIESLSADGITWYPTATLIDQVIRLSGSFANKAECDTAVTGFVTQLGIGEF